MIDEGVTAVLAVRATTQNGDDIHTSRTGVRRNERAIRECTYQDFMKCQPLFFKGTEGVVDLTQWFERMEIVFRIMTNEVAYAMTWTDLKKKMTTKYCPRNEIKKIEAELMFPEETDKIERYVGRMPDLIYSSVVASKPKTMQEAIEMATELMDRRNNTFAERQAENKRKFEDTPRNNQNQQPNKRQNTGRAYAAGNGDKKPYEGTKPLCPKCNFNHYGPCIPTCNNCKKLGHLAKDCRSRPATANNNNNNRNNNNNNNRNNNNNNNRNNNNPRAQGANTNAIVCFECGAPGHFKKDCPQWKNKNQGNGNAVARAYAVGVAGQNPDNNVVTGTFLLNNRCASILFDTGADRSFVSTQFSTLINIAPTTLDHGYNVELADGRIIWVNTVLLGCTLNFLNHPFHVDLMPVEMGTYDVIIGMDWLTKYQAVIDCAKKIVRIPFGSEILIFHGDGSRNKRGTRLNIISCTKRPEVSAAKMSLFPEDLPGLPTYQDKWRISIDLVPGVAPNQLTYSIILYGRGLLKIDLRSGYHQLRVREEDISKTAFRDSLWTLLNSSVLPFVLTIRTDVSYGPMIPRKEREPPLRVRALVMTISLDLPKQILNAQTEARKPENIKNEDVGENVVRLFVGCGWRSSTPVLEIVQETTEKNPFKLNKGCKAAVLAEEYALFKA
ncbi:putative reverse transcriptase domain-containing protein [Tanacetum coccineum]|uniref:Reverse transcriptase domain-containing protein n=1 Tax=Tanacetum coccineum TaxID=301880 RepID=A0ABQ4YWN7_9ASTR